MEEPCTSLHILLYTRASIFSDRFQVVGFAGSEGISIVPFGRFCQVALQTGHTSLQTRWQQGQACISWKFVQTSSTPVSSACSAPALCSEPETILLGQMLSGTAGFGLCCCCCQITKGVYQRGALTHQGSHSSHILVLEH